MPMHNSSSDDEQWAPVSDLMAILMLVFMLIAMVLFVEFELGRQSNQNQCDANKNRLASEFHYDFAKWGAKLDKDLTIRFPQNVFFKVGEADVEGEFAKILESFFPRYMGIVREIQDSPKDEILEIRIEGHTSSEYGDETLENAFIKNMELSQDRARNILQYVLDPAKIFQVAAYEKIVKKLVTANGLSSSRRLCRAGNNGVIEEDKDASRRVVFKLLTEACQKSGAYDKIDQAESLCS